MKRTTHRLSGRMTRRVVTLLRQRGADLRGLPLEVLENRDARVDVRLVDELLERASSALGAKGLSVALAEVFDEDTYDAAGRVMLAEPTLGAAFTAAFAHQRLWGDGDRFSLKREAGRLMISFRHPGASPLASAISSELAFIELISAATMLASVKADTVAFSHAKLGDLREVFGVEPSYRRARNELTLNDAPLTVPRELMQRVLAHDARRAMDQLPPLNSFASLAREQVHDFPPLAVLARRLHVSPRTLQRRLAQEGTSHFELVDELRQRVAERLRSKGLDEKAIAHAVGFSDERALSRARQRWEH